MKDAKGHGSNARPIPNSLYHMKSDAELRFIAKDAAEAGRNAQGMGDDRGASKYADQVADAATVLGYRARGGLSDHPNDMAARAASARATSAPVHEAMGGPAARTGSDYFARVSSRNGSKLGEYGPHPDRETAAAQAFAKHPKAKTVSTYRGHGMDIRWQNKD